MMALTEEERIAYCDPHFYRLMKVVMIADSESYNFTNGTQVLMKARAEFIQNNDKMVKKWYESLQDKNGPK
jgi:hypothetical protein